MLRSFVTELRRRKVVRVAVVYAIVAWAVVQVAATVQPYLTLPSSFVTIIIVLAALGFPLALVSSWLFDWTPDGVTRTQAGPAMEAPRVPSELAVGGAPASSRTRPRTIGAAVLLTALALTVGYGRFRHARAAAPETIRSIAVLPFVNMSGDKQNEYFSDGITDEILDALAKVPGLKVAARTSASQFKGKDVDMRTIGRALDVGAVLEGGVQREGDRVRITAQLINAATGYHMWSERYDRGARDLFAVEDELSKAIADQLRIRLGGGGVVLAKTGTFDVGAHDLYLIGLDYWTRRDAASLRKAIGAFQQAVAADSGYAQAYAGLALSYAVWPIYDTVSAPEAFARGRDAARKALALDPRLPEAYAALSQIAAYAGQPEDAERNAREAVRLNPNYATAQQWLAEALVRQGRIPEARAAIDRAVALDPLSATVHYVRGAQVLASEGDYDGTIAELRRSLDLNPSFTLAHEGILVAAVEAGRFDEAREAVSAYPGGPASAAVLSQLVDAVADPARHPAVVRLLSGPVRRGVLPPNLLVFFYEVAGVRDSAVAVLRADAREQEAIGRQPWGLQRLLRAPAMKALREDPRVPPSAQPFGATAR